MGLRRVLNHVSAGCFTRMTEVRSDGWANVSVPLERSSEPAVVAFEIVVWDDGWRLAAVAESPPEGKVSHVIRQSGYTCSAPRRHNLDTAEQHSRQVLGREVTVVPANRLELRDTCRRATIWNIKPLSS